MNQPSLVADLRRLTLRGASFAFVGQGASLAINLLSIVILSRLLTPQEFGIYAILLSVVAFVDVFRDMGLSTAAIQQRTVDSEQISALFWVNQAVGLSIALIMLLLAPAVAYFFADTRLSASTATLAILFILGALAAQHQALLRRQMRVATLMIIEVTAKLLGNVIAILLAFLGYGLWSLIGLQVASATTIALGVWIMCNWYPARPRYSSISTIAPMLNFGGGLTLSAFLNYLLRNLDNVIIGGCLGAEAVGYYSRAYTLLLFPLGQITAPLGLVAVPVLSQLQGDPDRYRRYYLGMLGLVAHVSMPLVACMGALSGEIVWIALGPQWREAGQIFQFLAVSAFWTAAGSTTGWLYISLGQTYRMALWTALATPTTIAAFLIGVAWGTYGVAVAYSIVICCQIIPQFWFALRGSPIKLSAVLRCFIGPMITSAAIIVGIVGIKLVLQQSIPPVALSAGLVWALTVWTVSSLVNREIVSALQDLANTIRKQRTSPQQ